MRTEKLILLGMLFLAVFVLASVSISFALAEENAENEITVTGNNAGGSLIDNIPVTNGGYVYVNGIKWRVIGKSDSAWLLISADVLRIGRWEIAKEYCGTVFNGFSKLEKNAVKLTSKKEKALIIDHNIIDFSLSDATLFLLSASEVETYFSSSDDRLPGNWWLRSPHSDYEADYVYVDGTLDYSNIEDFHTLGARPAFQLNLNSVLFTSAAEGSKSTSAEGGGSFGTISAPSGDAKLTLIDSSRPKITASVGGASSVTVAPGGSLDVSYSGVTSGDNLSALLCDLSGSILYYASLTPDASGSGTWNMTLPSGLTEGNYTLKLFSEQLNGDKKTDYTSETTSITLTVPGTIDGIPVADGGYLYVNGIKWRVIGMSDTAWLLISAEVLGGNRTWESAKAYCGEVFNAFSVAEQNAVKLTSKTDGKYTSTEYKYSYASSTLSNATLFLLSASEAETYFSSNADRKPGGWWLRSPHRNISNFAGVVHGRGSLSNSDVDIGIFGARPAFQLNLSSVLFTSAAEGGKSTESAGSGEFGTIIDPSGNAKLTLIDSSRPAVTANVAGAGSTIAAPGGSLAVSYSGVTSGDNISALLCDSSGAILYYASLTPAPSGSGTWNMTLPAALTEGSYTLKLFSEQLNGDRKTDYASPYSSVSLMVTGDYPPGTTPTPTVTATGTTTPSPTPSVTVSPVPSPTPSPTKIPQTGDTANLPLWFGMVLLGLIGTVAVWIAKYRKQ